MPPALHMRFPAHGAGVGLLPHVPAPSHERNVVSVKPLQVEAAQAVPLGA